MASNSLLVCIEFRLTTTSIRLSKSLTIHNRNNFSRLLQRFSFMEMLTRALLRSKTSECVSLRLRTYFSPFIAQTATSTGVGSEKLNEERTGNKFNSFEFSFFIFSLRSFARLFPIHIIDRENSFIFFFQRRLSPSHSISLPLLQLLMLFISEWNFKFCDA